MAIEQELLIKLTADNADMKKKLSESKSSLEGFGNSLGKLGPMIAGAFAVGSIVAFGKSAFEAAEKSEKANKRLMFSLQGNTTAYNELIAQASKLRKETGVSGSEIKQIQQLGANAGYTTSFIKKMVEASVNLASVTGQDLQGAFMQLNMTMTGSAGRLGRVDKAFKELSPEALKAGGAIDLAQKKYAGFAAASATETEKLSSNISAFKVAVGKNLLESGNGFIGLANEIVKAITPVNLISDAMSEERTRVNALTLSLMDNNTNQKTKKSLYDQLNKIAPEVLKGIDLENISTINLSKNLSEYNKQALNKIMLQRNKEKIDIALNKEADATERLGRVSETVSAQTDKLYGNIAAGSDKTKKNAAIRLKADFISGHKSLIEFATGIAELSGELGNFEQATPSYGNISSTSTAQKAINQLTSAQQVYNSAAKTTIDLMGKLQTPAEIITPLISPGAGAGESKKDGKIDAALSAAATLAAQREKLAAETFTSEEDYDKKILESKLQLFKDQISIYEEANKIVKKGSDENLSYEKSINDIKVSMISAQGDATKKTRQQQLDADTKYFNDLFAEVVKSDEDIAKQKKDAAIKLAEDTKNAQKEYDLNKLSSYEKEKALIEASLVDAASKAELMKQLEIDTNNAKAESMANMFGQAAALFKENTIAYKAMATAQIMISTYIAAMAAYADGTKYGGPILGAVYAAIAVAAGLANIAKVNGIAFADGGIVSGPTNALIGEYAGARSNPEVVAPLDKLRGMLGGGRQQVEVVGYISGDVIRLANKRSEYILNRRG